MASEVLKNKSLALAFQEGMDEDGKPIIKRYSFSNVSPTATTEDLVQAADAIASLTNGTVQEYTAVTTNVVLS